MKRLILNKTTLVFLAVTVLLNLAFDSFSQVNKTGFYIIKNYTRKDYNASEQNWSIIKDKRGVMYFGNNDNGVLEYDGVSWNSIPISNNSIVRSLAIDTLGTVYVGAFDEFGFLTPNSSGELVYHSLINQIDTAHRSFGNVWKTFSHNDEIIFASQKYLFKFKNLEHLTTAVLPEDCFISFQIGDSLLISNYNVGLLSYNWTENTLDTVNGNNLFAGQGKEIFTILPYNQENILISSPYLGEIALFSDKTLQKSLFPNSHLNKSLETDFVYNGTKIKDEFFFATISNNAGVFSIDENGEIISRINDKSGLQENQSSFLFSSQGSKGQYPLWITLSNGISKAMSNSPFKRIASESGLKGIVMDIAEFNNTKYIATLASVYYIGNDNNETVIKKLEGINRVWALETFKLGSYEVLIVASQDGLFAIDRNNNISLFKKNDGSDFIAQCYGVVQSAYDHSKIFLPLSAGYTFYSYKNGWEKLIEIPISHPYKFMGEIAENEYLLATEFNGVDRLMPDGKIIQYGIEDGLPALDYNKIHQFGKEVLIATQKGIYYFDRKSEKFKPFTKIHPSYSDGSKNINLIDKDRFGNYWLYIIDNEGSHIEKATTNSSGEYDIIEIPFRILPDMSIQAFFTDENNLTWICGSDGLYIFDNNFQKDYEIPYNALIRTVTIGEDSIIFNGAFADFESDSFRVTLDQTKHFKPTLNYKNNNIKFTYSAPFFDNEEGILFSHFLEGNDEDWSKWHAESFSIYTNLGERKNYTFKVKAKNIYGTESEVATYSFRILPPWQRTVWAFIAYGIVAILFIYTIVKLNARRLIKEKERLEQIVRERTKEIRQQKEEIETQRDEIAAQRDTLEVLNQEIEKKNENITASIRYAERIQKAILPSDDYVKSLLPDSFVLFKPKDIVSGDFYFCDKMDDIVVFTAVDCTGHGVPGAFVSIVGSNWLTRALNEEKLTKPSDIINYLSQGVYKTLQRDDDSKVKDGMDLSLVALDLKNMKCAWAGAYNPLYLYRKGEVIQFKADVFPVGTPFNERFSGYTNHEFDLEEGDGLYVFSDGYIDQFGGPNRKKFMKKNFRELIGSIQDKSMDEQKSILDERIEEWKKMGDTDQIDDILVFGVRV